MIRCFNLEMNLQKEGIALQKAVDTVNHNILLKKLQHYGIKGIANDWFKSYLTDRVQFCSINGFNSEKKYMTYGVPQGSVLGPLLFLIYINDLNRAIKYSIVNHFADDTNLFNSHSSLKSLQNRVNYDLKQLSKWLRANKISLNASKTEVLIFTHKNKQMAYRSKEGKLVPWELKIKIDGKKIFPSPFVKYLGVIIDSKLNWKFHLEQLTVKLSRAIGMLAKIRHYVDKNTIIMIYHGIFSSIMQYALQIWSQDSSIVSKIEKLQSKAIRIITFDRNSPIDTLFHTCGILKICDSVKLLNFLFAHDTLKGNLPNKLCYWLIPKHTTYKFRSEVKNSILLFVPKIRTVTSGSNSIKYKSSKIWNEMITLLPKADVYKNHRTYCKDIRTKHFF